MTKKKKREKDAISLSWVKYLYSHKLTPDTWSLGFNLDLLYLNTILPEKAMAPHSSTLAWKIPWTEEPGGLQSMGLLKVRHD